MDASTRQNYDRATAPRIHTHCTQTARNEFLQCLKSQDLCSDVLIKFNTRISNLNKALDNRA